MTITLDQFLDKVKKAKLHWMMTDCGLIRALDTRQCPIARLASDPLASNFEASSGVYDAELGLTKDTRRTIVRAADRLVSSDPAVYNFRLRLLKACQLKERY